MDALPRTDVYAAFAHDAFTLVNVNELLGLYSLTEIIGVHLNQLILG